MGHTYALWDHNGRRVWALILKTNKNGTCRVKISNNWQMTVDPIAVVTGEYIQANFLNKGEL